MLAAHFGESIWIDFMFGEYVRAQTQLKAKGCFLLNIGLLEHS